MIMLRSNNQTHETIQYNHGRRLGVLETGFIAVRSGLSMSEIRILWFVHNHEITRCPPLVKCGWAGLKTGLVRLGSNLSHGVNVAPHTLGDSNKLYLSISSRVQDTFLKWASFKKKGFYRFDCIFEAQKHDCNKTKFDCPEETSPYLRKPFPRKILYLNPLTHKYPSLVRALRALRSHLHNHS